MIASLERRLPPVERRGRGPGPRPSSPDPPRGGRVVHGFAPPPPSLPGSLATRAPPGMAASRPGSPGRRSPSPPGSWRHSLPPRPRARASLCAVGSRWGGHPGRLAQRHGARRLPPHRRTAPVQLASMRVDAGRSGGVGDGRVRHPSRRRLGGSPVTGFPSLGTGAGSGGGGPPRRPHRVRGQEGQHVLALNDGAVGLRGQGRHRGLGRRTRRRGRQALDVRVPVQSDQRFRWERDHFFGAPPEWCKGPDPRS